jgi:DNA processing protein
MNHPQPSALSAADKLDWLRLIRSKNVGPVTFFKLLDRFGTATAALDALPDLAIRGGAKKRIIICSKSDAELELETLEKFDGKLLAHGEADYPPLLAHTEGAPPLLTVRGHAHLLSKRAVAVVGARNASLNARNFARRISHDLGTGGFLVVSGMARGIDTAAHKGALESGTVAVLGGGVDVVYPKENQSLYDKLVQSGVVVSEMPPGTKPIARHFPQRNRIISGISRGVVVVEASPRSGSLITARLAAEQGREVFAVPGSPLDPRASGTNQLIRNGATLTESANDVFETLKGPFSFSLSKAQPIDLSENYSSMIDENEISKAHSVIKEFLSPSAVSVDEIIRSCQFSPPVVASVLLELELAGLLERHPGNRVSTTQEL